MSIVQVHGGTQVPQCIKKMRTAGRNAVNIMKSEILIPKSETNTNSRNPKVQNRDCRVRLFLRRRWL